MWLKLALMLPTLIVKTIQTVETLRGPGPGHGPEKKAAVKAIAAAAVELTEGVAGVDLFNDPEVQAAVDALIAAKVHLSNILTRKAAAVPPLVPPPA